MILPKGPKIYFPNVIFTMIRSNIPRRANEVTFRVPTYLTKYDIAQYLEKLYNVRVVNVTTTNFPRLVVRSTRRIIPAKKNAVVEIGGDFTYPSVPNKEKLVSPVSLFRATRRPMPQ